MLSVLTLSLDGEIGSLHALGVIKAVALNNALPRESRAWQYSHRIRTSVNMMLVVQLQAKVVITRGRDSVVRCVGPVLLVVNDNIIK